MSTPRPSAASRSISAASTSALAASTPRERLVEQHEAGVLHERARDQHALALAARELAECASRRAPRARPRPSASSARAALAPARAAPPRQPRDRAHQRHVERASPGSRAASARSAARRCSARTARAGRRAAPARRAGRAGASTCRRRSGPSTPSRWPGSTVNVTPSSTGRAAVADGEIRGRDERHPMPAIAHPRAPPVKPRVMASAFACSIAEVGRAARVARAERVAVERVVGPRARLARDLLGQLRAQRALGEDRAHVLAAHQPHEIGDVAGRGLRLRRLRRDHRADDLDAVAVREVVERVVVGDELALAAGHAREARAMPASSARRRFRYASAFAR